MAVAHNYQGIYEQQSNNIRVPVKGQTIPPGGGITFESPILILPGTPPLPFEDPENHVNHALYDFSIVEDHAFLLPMLSNSLVGTTYGVDIQFSKLPGSSSFALRPNGNTSGYAIPYQLKFLGQPVIKDVSIPWTPLTEGLNIQNILITEISPTVAKAAPSGPYIDTIVVTITVIE